MVVFINDRFMPEEQALVSVFDRSFLYGDGLFETIRFSGQALFQFQAHLERLRAGAAFLGIPVPLTDERLRQTALELLQQNDLKHGLLRINLSRGIGTRGYSPKGANTPALVMTVHPLAQPPANGFRLITSSIRLPAPDLLSQFKTCNKLPQIIARAEAEKAGADEALLLNTDGYVVEASAGNLFWIQNGCVVTAPVAGGILPGVTRGLIHAICQRENIPFSENQVTLKVLLDSDGIFLSYTSFGVVEALSLNGHPLKRSPLIGRLRSAYESIPA